MSNSGSGRSWVDFSDDQDEREPPELLEDPRIAADRALHAVPWLYATDRIAILDALDKAGLTICWKP